MTRSQHPLGTLLAVVAAASALVVTTNAFLGPPTFQVTPLRQHQSNAFSRTIMMSVAEPPPKRKTEAQLRRELQERNQGPRSIKYTPFNYTREDEKLVIELTKERPWLQFILEKGLEVVDDIYREFRETTAIPDPAAYRKELKSGAAGQRERIVVLGTGWGSHAFLSSIDATKFEVVVVSPRNFFLHTPLLSGSAVGTVEYRSITEPIRNANKYADYLEATCTKVDSANKEVFLESVKCEGVQCEIVESKLSYDYLLVAIGASTNTYGVPGVKEHCFFLKSVADAVKIRAAIGNAFERANMPGLSEEDKRHALTFVVVGAGPTGIELSAELQDFVQEDVPRYYPELLPYVKIKLLEASDTVLMMFDKALQKAAISQLTQTPYYEIMLKAGVKEVKATEIVLSDNRTIPYGMAVWAAGNGPLPLVQSMIDSVPEQQQHKGFGRGRLVTDDWCRLKGAPDVFAIGDCSVILDKPLPPNAQVASQQGMYLGRLLSRNYDFRPDIPIRVGPPTTPSEYFGIGELKENEGQVGLAKPFQFLNQGVLAYTGSNSALAQVNVDKKMVKSSGVVGFLLWRSVYLSKQVSMRNRVMVFMDWIKRRIFGRDITRFPNYN